MNKVNPLREVTAKVTRLLEYHWDNAEGDSLLYNDHNAIIAL